jgi:hypothetical protein
MLLVRSYLRQCSRVQAREVAEALVVLVALVEDLVVTAIEKITLDFISFSGYTENMKEWS